MGVIGVLLKHCFQCDFSVIHSSAPYVLWLAGLGAVSKVSNWADFEATPKLRFLQFGRLLPLHTRFQTKVWWGANA